MSSEESLNISWRRAVLRGFYTGFVTMMGFLVTCFFIFYAVCAFRISGSPNLFVPFIDAITNPGFLIGVFFAWLGFSTLISGKKVDKLGGCGDGDDTE